MRFALGFALGLTTVVMRLVGAAWLLCRAVTLPPAVQPPAVFRAVLRMPAAKTAGRMQPCEAELALSLWALL